MKQRLESFQGASSVRRAFTGLGLAALAFPVLVQAASAQQFLPTPGDISIRAGAAGLFFDSSADFELAGTELAGAGIDTSDNLTASLEVEYFFTSSFGVALTAGIPPTVDVDGTGTIEAFGELGEVKYGLAALMGKYHFNYFGRFQPFVGAGLAYFIVFDEDGKAITDLEVDDTIGPVIQAGADFMVTERIGAFASVSHAFMDTEGKGVVLGLPVTADIDLDPTVIQAGLFFRF